ncbi:MAG TPA: TolC family protein [Vicinamibacterales bacterium]|nr:TolC family protein [Vicinamibacterales bacterium]
MRIPARTRLSWLCALACGGAWSLAVPAYAQAPAPLDLSVSDAVRMGVEHAPRVIEAHAKTEAANQNVRALIALALPTATAQMQYLRWSHVPEFLIPDGAGGLKILYPDIPNNYRGRVEVTAPIYSFGRIKSNVTAAREDVAAAEAGERQAASDVRYEVMRAYWLLATVRENVSVLVQSLARTDAWVGDVQSRVDTGLLPPNEVQSAQAQRARQQVRLLQAQNDEALAELVLARLIGVPAGTAIRTASPVDQPLPQAVELESMTADQLIARATGQRADHEGLTAQSEGLRQSARAAIANLNPYAVGLAAVEPARPNARFVPPIDAWHTSWTVDLKFVWPFFDGGRAKAQAAALTAQAAGVDARRDDLDSAIGLEIRQRLLDLRFGRAQINASSEGVLAAAEARRVVGERFAAGVALSSEVLDAQVALLEAQLERSRLYAALRITEAQLIHAVGER